MMHRRTFLGAMAGLVAILGGARRAFAADDLVLVLHGKNGDSPDAAAAKRLFLGEAAYWPGNVPVHVVMRPNDAAPTEAFFRTIGVTPARFKRIWQERQLSGQGVVPDTVGPAAALVARIAADRGGIGFALASEIAANTPGIRVVALR